MNLNDIVYEAMELAKESLKKEKELIHLLIGFGMNPVLAPVLVDRELWPILATKVALGNEVVVHVSDAWKKSMTADEYFARNGRQISSYEDRIEVIIVEGKNKAGELIILNQDYERDWDGNIVFKGKVQRLDGEISSRVLDGLWR